MFTRRHFLAATALTSASFLTRSGISAYAARFETPLPIPQLIVARANANAVSLTIGQGVHAYRPGQSVQSFGYSAPVLGPVIRLAQGESVNITIENKMSRPTTVHWHGLIIPGEVDGGPHNSIAAGNSWKASLRVDQPECTAWFHPHPHGETAEQFYFGLAGMILVEDGSGERMGLPRSYGVDDLPLVLQDRFFDRGGAPVYQPGPMDIMAGYRGDTIIVDGTVAPVARVPAGLVRLRLLNAANARIFDLRFSDGRTFQVIASDGGYLTAPVRLRSLLIAPGERYEVLVDFADGSEVVLETGADQNIPMMGMMRGAEPLASGGSIMKFQVDPAQRAAVTSVPKQLIDVPLLDRSKVVARRQFLLNDMMMGGMMGGGMMGGMGFGGAGRRFGPAMAINGQPFDKDRIDVETKLGTMELWEIGSQTMAHPFHVHGTQFQILSLNGQVPPLHMQGWKDTVLVAREAQILVPLNQIASRDHPFMSHCHILEHEDAGMMGQYICV
jgi:FtsP/CotA-like multicopper oxidase with cupredoxin domain